MKGNPVIEAASRAEKMKQAFERENRLRDKVVKAMSDATGISEKVFVNETGPVIVERLHRWVKDTKNKAKKGYSALEARVEALERRLEEKEEALERWAKRTARIRGVAEQLCAEVERKVRQIRILDGMPEQVVKVDAAGVHHEVKYEEGKE